MLFFILIHIIVAIAYYILWYKKSKEESIYRFVVILSIPIFGFLYFTVLNYFVKTGRVYMGSGKALHDLDKDVTGIGYVKINVEKEIDVLPMEEVFDYADDSLKRKYIIDAMKEDVSQYLEFLNRALKDEDAETSHYAASAIMEIKRKLTLKLQQFAVRYEEDRSNPDISSAYADALKDYIESGAINKITYDRYKKIYSDVLSNVLKYNTMEEKYFVDKINCDLEMNDYSSAKSFCDIYLSLYPQNPKPYIMKMKLYYKLRDYDKLRETTELLKSTDLKFNNEVISLIRYWDTVEEGMDI